MRKQTLKRMVATGLITAGFLTSVPISASSEWRQDNAGWWYTEGNSWATGWKLIDGKWYFFDNNGYMKTGWVKYGDKWYYLYSDGDMAKNATIDGYTLNSDGIWTQSPPNSSSNSKETSNASQSGNNSGNNYSEASSTFSKDIEQAVSQAIKSKGQDLYLKGEVATEGHIILDVEEKDGLVKAYTISSFGYFGFENSIFTEISGSGAIPTVITFSENANGEYSLVEYKEPLDGDECLDSTKKMFPQRLWDKVLAQDDTLYPKLSDQKKSQAEQYILGIGRTAKVSSDYVEKKLPNIDVEASNKLFAEWGKDDSFLNNCPYWLGTVEKFENGVRVIYETAQSKSNNGYDVITFEKMKEDGTVIEERIYKIVGSEPMLQ